MACLRQSRVVAGVERCGVFSNCCICVAAGVMFVYFYVRLVAWLEVTYVACCGLFKRLWHVFACLSVFPSSWLQGSCLECLQQTRLLAGGDVCSMFGR